MLLVRGNRIQFEDRFMSTVIKIFFSMFFISVLVGTSLIIMRICWGVWPTVSDVVTFMGLPLNQNPEPATLIAIGIVSYILLIVKSTYNFNKKLKELRLYKE
jgi:hypothetical protein